MTVQRYHLRYQWLEAPVGYGVLYYTEFDADGWEMRRVDVMRDGAKVYADLQEDCGTWLSDKPMPDQMPPEFRPAVLTAAEFEEIWALRHEPGPPPF